MADHVTLSVFGKEAPQPVDAAFIIARVDDDLGVEAFIVSIAGSTARPDGGTWHITWSLADGRAARESNDVIASKPWAPMPAMALSLYPAHW
ncbi:hypothetical protein [Novosphingobium taihuense]|uniref:Uncharacterized protein n=1 Tax=Novosphingobium taihuense TaxID=260085 RepID=A0A7W7ACN2_9SPHN|nr:hypothetical protein [Novosphingobium taihuense]MBB4613722.1 hypothetical protein [Novosphingobium taihuense]